MKKNKMLKFIVITFIALFSLVDFAKAEVIEFTSIDELKTYYPEEVTVNKVKTAIENNNNLSEKYKEIANTLLVRVDPESNDPTPIDLRIFYENIKTLKVNECTSTEFASKKFYNVGIEYGKGADYDEKENTLYVIKGTEAEAIAQGLAKAFFHFYHENNGNAITRRIKYKSLDLFASFTLAKSIYDYNFQIEPEIETSSNIIRFLESISRKDAVVFWDYSVDAGDTLIKRYKEQYNGVDIDYVIESLDKINAEEIEVSGNYYLSHKDLDLINELFKILEVKAANNDEAEEKYNNFTKMFVNAEDPYLVFEYLEKYRKLEISNNYLYTKEEAIKIFEPYKEVDSFITTGGKLYPAICSSEAYCEIIKEDGTKEKVEFSVSDIDGMYDIQYGFTPYISSTISRYWSTSNYPKIDWEELNEEYRLISPHYYKDIITYYNGKKTENIRTSTDTIEIGIDSNKKIGFIIRDKNNNIVLETAENLKQLSNKVKLSYYMGFDYNYYQSIHLDDILNEEYLTIFQSTDGFNNIRIENNKLVFIDNEENEQPGNKHPNEVDNPDTGLILSISVVIISIILIIGIYIKNKNSKKFYKI